MVILVQKVNIMKVGMGCTEHDTVIAFLSIIEKILQILGQVLNKKNIH